MVQHTAQGRLRVLMLKGRHRLRAHQLAWDYDLVITDFNQLSTWDAKQCPVLQVQPASRCAAHLLVRLASC